MLRVTCIFRIIRSSCKRFQRTMSWSSITLYTPHWMSLKKRSLQFQKIRMTCENFISDSCTQRKTTKCILFVLLLLLTFSCAKL